MSKFEEYTCDLLKIKNKSDAIDNIQSLNLPENYKIFLILRYIEKKTMTYISDNSTEHFEHYINRQTLYVWLKEIIKRFDNFSW